MLSQSRFVLEIVNQAGFYAYVPREISVPTELAIGHLRCRVTDMPPQPNSLSGRCLETRLPHPRRTAGGWPSFQHRRKVRGGTAASGEATTAVAITPYPTLDGGAPRYAENHWSLHSISEATFRVVVFHLSLRYHLYYTSDVAAQSQTGVKLNRVFFPRLALQVRSLDCRFAR